MPINIINRRYNMAVRRKSTAPSARSKSTRSRTHARKQATSSRTSSSRSTRSRRTGTMSRSEAASVAGSAPHRCRGRECWYM
jgi:hypothetical protein